MNIDQLNRLTEEEARTAFEQCCGASQWVDRMVFSRPFESLGEVLETAATIWEECDVDDYEEAFAMHPRIGDQQQMAQLRQAGNSIGDLHRKWAAGELRGLEGADAAVLLRMAEANAKMEERFGHSFVACVPGKSAAELLALMERRLEMDPKEEFLVAAAEQGKLMQLRLKKLLA